MLNIRVLLDKELSFCGYVFLVGESQRQVEKTQGAYQECSWSSGKLLLKEIITLTACTNRDLLQDLRKELGNDKVEKDVGSDRKNERKGEDKEDDDASTAVTSVAKHAKIQGCDFLADFYQGIQIVLTEGRPEAAFFDCHESLCGKSPQ